MDDIQKTVADTVDEFCNKFCKYSFHTENRCVWEDTHMGDCPFKKLMQEVGLCE